jgi:3-hydroxyisobutyrate dehydrogenase-like beta-hydroxyacid dehydrogenase
MSTPPATTIAIIGYGEVGKIFSGELIALGYRLRCYDILLDDAKGGDDRKDAKSGDEMRAHAAAAGVTACGSLAEAMAGAHIAISAVIASAALAVAEEAARHVRPGQFFLDLNSASPGTKQASAAAIDAAGGDYVEAAVMASVPPYGIKVPIILGGKKRAALMALLPAAQMQMQAGVEQIGVASAVKMCRSIMIKGIEALTVECLLTARRYGVEERVLESLDETFPHMDWQKQGDYLVSRVVQHGRRRAAEMREVARTVAEAGLTPLLAAPTAQRQDWMADQVAEGTVPRGEKSWRKVADLIKEKTSSKEQESKRKAAA